MNKKEDIKQMVLAGESNLSLIAKRLKVSRQYVSMTVKVLNLTVKKDKLVDTHIYLKKSQYDKIKFLSYEKRLKISDTVRFIVDSFFKII